MISALAAAFLLTLGQAATPPAAAPPKPAGTVIAQSGTLKAVATAEIVDTTGKRVGGAFFYEGPNGVLMRIEVSGLTPGWHGAHLHQKGVCEGPKFESAGPHFDPGSKEHGLLHPSGPEAGDLPSIFAERNGVARTSLFSHLFSITGQGGRPKLLDADGASIVIHAGPDDQSTQPIGGSGDRVACGVIKPAAA